MLPKWPSVNLTKVYCLQRPISTALERLMSPKLLGIAVEGKKKNQNRLKSENEKRKFLNQDLQISPKVAVS